MDGVFLSAQVAALRERITGRSCEVVGVPSKEALGLALGDGLLVLSARPDGPALWWSPLREMAAPVSPTWGHHLEGGRILSVTQQGADRVLEIASSSGLLYGESGARLIFEATGRNANILLVRISDGRILACLRRVTQDRCRYRTLAPGERYVPPPPSGLHPGEWTANADLMAALSREDVTPAALYRSMEGVGPLTAGALLAERAASGIPLPDLVARLETALLREEFAPWLADGGPLPLPLGPGRLLADPLSEDIRTDVRSAPAGTDGRLSEWLAVLASRGARIARRIASLEAAAAGLVPAETSRLWGTLLLSKGERTRGATEAVLTDWEGREHRIPLRAGRTVVENAARYFRKAASADREARNLERLREAASREAAEVQALERQAPALPPERIDALLAGAAASRRKPPAPRGGNPPLLLSDGWRCFVGRNAADNERITFTVGRRGDLWFHARGRTGPHVVLKLDGRRDNPSARVMVEAAAEAARGGGTSSGVVPVDWTPVQYVRRMKQGKPGQVVYSREKTLFVDLDGLPRRDRSPARQEEPAADADGGEGR